MKPFIGMIAGGTGITPMYQVIREVLGNEEDKTRLTLIYANRSEKDILLKAELDQLQAWYPRRFQVHYVVEHAEDEATFDGFTGFVTTDVAKKVRCRLAHRGPVLSLRPATLLAPPRRALTFSTAVSVRVRPYARPFASRCLPRLLQLLPPPTDDTLILVCGPPGMMNFVSGGKAADYTQGKVGAALKALGFDERMVYKF